MPSKHVTMNDIPKMSESELEEFFDSAEFDTRGYNYALQLLTAKRLKQLKKHHWSVTPLFWVSVVGAVAAVVAAYYAYLAYSQPQKLSVASPQSQNEPSAFPKQSPQLPLPSPQQSRGKP